MRYFIAKNGVQLGPFEAREVQEQLASGAVSLEDLVWRDGMAAWAPLRTEFSPTTPPPISLVGNSADPSPAAILTLVNAAVGAYLGATGRHPLFR